MKTTLVSFFLLVCALLNSTLANEKGADSFFPANTGFKWIYKTTPLDSLNQPMTDLTFYTIDTFAVNNFNWQGKSSKLILTKIPNTQLPPESTLVSFENNDASLFFRAKTNQIAQDPYGITNLLNSFEGWYTPYRFGSSQNISYPIFSKDTTITVDSISLPLRFDIKGKRLSDNQITTPTGTFNCKRFVLTGGVSYLVNIPPLPIYAVSLYQIPDTIYVAPGNWIIRQARNTQKIDLNQLAQLTGSSIVLPKFYINGSITEVTDHLPATNIETSLNPSCTILKTYPNPFNNSTAISFDLKEQDDLTVSIYNLKGSLVEQIKNRFSAGNNKLSLNFSDFSAGVYFVELKGKSVFASSKVMYVK